MLHEKYMHRCLELAKKGIGNVSPNPMVGSVIVYQDKIIGEGYHQKYGDAHAEVNAINSVKDKSLLPLSTLYVNLEPCSHYGNTPPCADLIIKHKLKKVVIGAVDTHSKVAGKGIKKLQDAGIEVSFPMLENACREANKRFYTVHEKNRPFVILKWAQTKQGFLSPKEDYHTFPFWITNKKTKVLTHAWRMEEDAILIGRKTAELDEPSLTCRWIKGEDPTRILVGNNFSGRYLSNTLGKNNNNLIISSNDKLKEKYSSAVFTPNVDPKSILSILHEQKISSVIVEGGTQTIQAFIDQNLWDEARVLIGNSDLTEGIKSPILPQTKSHQTSFGTDTIITHFPL